MPTERLLELYIYIIYQTDDYICIYSIPQLNDIGPAYKSLKNSAIDFYFVILQCFRQSLGTSTPSSSSTPSSPTFDFIASNCNVVIWLESAPSCAEVNVSAIVPGYCTMTIVVNSPWDTIDWSISSVSLQNTRYAKVTITRRLQTTRLRATYFDWMGIGWKDIRTGACSP
jgi:hypothetical protein